MGKKAPGPDGIQARLVAEAHRCAEATYRGLYEGCLRAGKFPDRWKVARVVLLKKDGKPDGEASSYRPLCLLNENGKMMERIIKNSVEEHMRESGESISENQFEFVKGRSTVDAIIKIMGIIENKIQKGLVTIAISLDISNAFNSLEWGEIKGALKRKKLPSYLQEIISSYLRNRKIIWVGKDGKKRYKKVERGVPQGSVLGPLLWNITYDNMLRMPTSADCDIVCYADDTLVIVGGKNMEKAVDRANILLNIIARKIKWMGLQVAAEKSEAIRFRRRGEKSNKDEIGIIIKNTRIVIGNNIKYLGMLVRDDWTVKRSSRENCNESGNNSSEAN